MGKKKNGLTDYSELVQKLFDRLEPVCGKQNVELVDVEYVKEGENWYLKLYIDRVPPVDLDCCQVVSEVVEHFLDKEDPIPHSYILEVSSPGIDRPLRKESDYTHFSGREITVKLFSPIDSKKLLVGTLVGLQSEQLIMKIDGDTIEIPMEKVAKVNLYS